MEAKMEAKELIMLVGGTIGSLILGWAMKKWPAMPNGMIPIINGAVFTLGFATVGGLGFTYVALMTGMSAAYTATALYEGKKAVAPGGVK